MGKPRVIICKECGETKPHKGHGLCNRCYFKFYYIPTKRVCKSCGKLTFPYTKYSCRKCYDKAKRSTPEYREKHRNEMREAYHANIDAARAKSNAYYHSEHGKLIVQRVNRKSAIKRADRIHAYNKEYRSKNRAKINAGIKNYKAKVRSLPYDLTPEQWENILKFYENRCAYCRKRSKVFHKEHKIPVTRDGPYSASNIVPSCPDCNSRKQNKTEEEFFEYIRLVP